MVHLYNGILFSRKKELLPFMTAWMELENIMLSKMTQAVKDKCRIISTKQTNEQNRTRDTEIKNKLMVTRGPGGGG